MARSPDLVAASEAAGRLGISRPSLYAYVSRGLIRSFASPRDPRERLYAADDVEALIRRRTRLRRPTAAAASALDWGLPVLETGLTRIHEGRLFYRNADAIAFAETATLEDAACLLVPGLPADAFARPSPAIADLGGPPRGSSAFLARAIGLLAQQAPSADGAATVAAVLRLMVAAATGADPGLAPLHEHLARGWGTLEAASAIRQALVLCADHELSASAFAVRVAASTGAALPHAVIAGLAALSGPRHGGATDRARDLLRRCREPGGLARVVAAEGDAPPVPLFGHPLYPDGDPRASALLAHLPLHPADVVLVDGMQRAFGEAPSIDVALVLAETSYDLPEGAAFALFATGRTVGWLAHALEQQAQGSLIRPRARYVVAEDTEP